MDEKKENCKRCGKKIEPKTKRAEFCSPKCKVYWHREKTATKKPQTPQIKDFNQPTNEVPNLTKEPPKASYTITTNIPPMPKREDFKDNWDYLAAKNEWKKLYNQ